MHFFVQTLIDAVSLGSLYTLFALGVALVFGIMRLINFAHGELIMCGCYAAVLTARPLIWVVLVTLLTGVLVALAIERLAFRPVRQASQTTMLVTSFAVSYGLQNAATVSFGSLERNADIAPSLSTSVGIGGFVVPALDIATVAVSVFLVGGLALFLARTSLGVQMRASAEDFPTARMLGVRANQVVAMAFAISGLFAGVAAILLIAQTGTVTPTIGVSPVLAAFVATVVGGIGRLEGAVIGGYLLGGLSTFFHAYLPTTVRPFDTALSYAAVIALLVVRPNGITQGRAAVAGEA